MVTNRFGNKNFMQPNENAQGSLAFIFRFLGEREGEDFYFYFSVPIKFLTSSPSSQCICEDIPNSTSFLIPYCLVTTSMSLSWKGGPKGSMTNHAYILGGAPCSRNSGDGPIT